MIEKYLSREKLNNVSYCGTSKLIAKAFLNKMTDSRLRTEMSISFHAIVVEGKNDFLKRSVRTGNKV